jgi:hypothetical protein
MSGPKRTHPGIDPSAGSGLEANLQAASDGVAADELEGGAA